MNTKQTLLELHEQTGNFSRIDGFQSRILRTAILSAVNTIPLAENNPSDANHPHRHENPRRNYLRAAAEAGEKLTMEYAMARLSPALDDFLQALVEHGAANLGHRIGLDYGYAMYPLAQYRRDHHLAIPEVETPDADANAVFGFTLTNDGENQTLSEVCPVPGPPGSEISELGDESGILETFAVTGRKNAESFHAEWRRYLDGRRPAAPVAYAIQVTVPPRDAGLEPLVGWLKHIAEGTVSGEQTTSDGVVVACQVYGSLNAALVARRQLIREYYAEEVTRQAYPEREMPVAARTAASPVPTAALEPKQAISTPAAGKSGKTINP